MRWLIILALALIGVAGLLVVLWGPSREESFDERFERADQRLEDMAKSIEADLDGAPDSEEPDTPHR